MAIRKIGKTMEKFVASGIWPFVQTTAITVIYYPDYFTYPIVGNTRKELVAKGSFSEDFSHTHTHTHTHVIMMSCMGAS